MRIGEISSIAIVLSAAGQGTCTAVQAQLEQLRIGASSAGAVGANLSSRRRCQCDRMPLQRDKLRCTQASRVIARHVGYHVCVDLVVQVNCRLVSGTRGSSVSRAARGAGLEKTRRGRQSENKVTSVEMRERVFRSRSQLGWVRSGTLGMMENGAYRKAGIEGNQSPAHTPQLS